MYAADGALSEREYIQMRQEYRARIRQAEKWLEDAGKKKKERAVLLEENPWLKAYAGFRGEPQITDRMAHALLSRVEISSDNSVAVSFRWQDEYRMLAEFLESEKGAGM